ncbi:MAG: MASE1 domain-containing protein, partial [Terriglobales bacterium]
MRAAVFAFAYFGSELLARNLAAAQNYNNGFWLPSGLFLGVLLLAERRHWLLLVLAAGVGDLAYNYATGAPWSLGFLFLFHLGNSLSAIVGAWLMRRFVAERPVLASVRELIGLVVFGGLLSLPLSTTIGTLLLQASNFRPNWTSTWSYRYSSDLLGVLLLTPVLLAWPEGIRWPASWRPTARRVEAAEMLLGLGAALSLSYYFHWPQEIEKLFVALPFIIWASFRFGLRGVT